MLKLDDNLLQELGLGTLPEDQKKAMLQHIYETLELRVGTQLANQMSDQQLDEFEQFIDSGGDANQAQALQWLESNLPNYKDVVNQVFESLKGEVKQMAPQIMSAAQQPAMPQPQAGQAQPDPQAYQQQQAGGMNYQAAPQPNNYAQQQPVYGQQPQQPFNTNQPSPQSFQQPVDPSQTYQPQPAPQPQYPQENYPGQQPGQNPVQLPPNQ